jgi:outer membrane protein OmpA-like peptidoglycan-associated protein
VIAARAGVLAVAALIPLALTATWIHSAESRVDVPAEAGAKAEPGAPVAAAADVGYCSPELKRILRRVLMSCGLVGGGAARGCQPLQAKNVATMSGPDFNALFQPMKERGGIVEFPLDKSDLGPEDLAMIDQVFADQRGASWFFVVARSSPEGSVEHNRDLSKARAEAVMAHLRAKFTDPDLDKEVGMLWLGEEFAQLDPQFCAWKRSSTGECGAKEINRSAFVAWIDCQL